MNNGIFETSYGAPLEATRVRYKAGQGANNLTGEALVLRSTDHMTGIMRSKGVGVPQNDRCDLVLPLPLTRFRDGFTPISAGALLVQVPDGTLFGGDMRGSQAVDLQSSRTASAQVASGAYSFTAGDSNRASAYASVALGSQNTSSANYTFAAGYGCLASGNNAVSMGGGNTSAGQYAVSLGSNTSASSAYAFAAGCYSTANGYAGVALGYNATNNSIICKFSMGSVSSALGGAQTGILALTNTATNATPLALTSDQAAQSTTNQLILPNSSAQTFFGLIVARRQASGGTQAASWRVEGLIRREANAASTVLVASTVTAISNVPGWALALTADTTNGGLAVTFTGAAATNVRVVASLYTAETVYA